MDICTYIQIGPKQKPLLKQCSCIHHIRLGIGTSATSSELHRGSGRGIGLEVTEESRQPALRRGESRKCQTAIRKSNDFPKVIRAWYYLTQFGGSQISFRFEKGNSYSLSVSFVFLPPMPKSSIRGILPLKASRREPWYLRS